MKDPKKGAGRKECPVASQFKLFESSEDSNKLIDNLWDVVLIINPKGRILYANNAVKRYGFSKKDLVGKLIYHFILKKRIPFIATEIIKVLKGKVSRENVEVITKKGIIIAEFASTPIKKNGKVIAVQAVLRNITERKKAEEKLQKSEEKYRFIVNNSREIILIISKAGKVIFANKSVLKTIGYSKKEVIGKQFKYFLTKDSVKKTLYSVKQDFLGNSKKIGVKVKTKSGEIRYWEFAKDVGFIREKGKVTSILVNGSDITERKKAEEKIKESEKRFRDIVESSADWIWEVDKNGKYTFASEKIKQILGYTPKEIIGKTPFDFMPKEEAKRVGEIFRKIVLKKKPIVDLENWNLTKQGKRICLLTNGVPMLDEKGKIIGYRGVDKDITERKKAEKAIHESERKYRATFESTGTAMIIIEEDTTISLANHQVELLTGYSREEIEDRMRWTEFVHKKDLKRMKKHHNDRRKPRRKAPKQYEFHLVDKKGNIKNMFITIDIIPGTKKSIASLMDITESKQIEQEIKKRNEELEKFNKFVVGRELRMVELKKKIRELEIMLRKKEKKK